MILLLILNKAHSIVPFLLKYPLFIYSIDQHFRGKNTTMIKNKDYRQKNKYSGRCSHQNLIYMQPNKLYEAINKMDCQLNQFRLNCPIHDLIF